MAAPSESHRRLVVRSVVRDANFYASAYVVAALLLLAATLPPINFVGPVLALALAVAFAQLAASSRHLRRNPPKRLDPSAVEFEAPAERRRRRLLMTHLPARTRATLAGYLVLAAAFGLITGVDRAKAVGGMVAPFLCYLAILSAGTAVIARRLERRLHAQIVTTTSPTPKAMPLYVLVHASTVEPSYTEPS
jgi:hypothetical protein